MISPKLREQLLLALVAKLLADSEHIRHRHRCECGHSWEHTAAEARLTPNAHVCKCGRRVTKPEFDPPLGERDENADSGH